MAAPTIVSITPFSGATGVPKNIQIEIIFDSEVDTYRLKNGGLVLEGPDESKIIGPGLIASEPPLTDEDSLLASPGYKGLVDFDLTFERVDDSGTIVGYYDYGSGALPGYVYRLKAVIAPKEQLKALTEYTIYIIGDEDTTDAYDYGVSSRSVFDTLADAGNTGNGIVSFDGGYTGAAARQYFVEITTAGDSGTARYKWWTSADPIEKVVTSSRGFRILSDGVYVKFTPGLTYEVGDVFSVWALPPTFMEGTTTASFTTSSIAPEEYPTPSSLVTGISSVTTSSSTTVSSSGFTVSSTVPEDRGTRAALDLTEITVTFTDDIDASTVSSDTVIVNTYPADESVDIGISATGELTTTLTVVDEVLTITLDADQLFSNNIVVVTLKSSLASEDAETLGDDYEFFFATILSPYYAGPRHVRLLLGSIGSSLPTETVDLAIWLASKEAMALVPTTVYDTSSFLHARNNFVACLAASYILNGVQSSNTGSSVRKRLADLDVSRGGNGLSQTLGRIDDCMKRYELAMLTGGDTGFGAGLKPQGVVKGDYSYDEPTFGRTWTSSSAPLYNIKETWDNHRRYYGSFLKRTRN